MQLREEEPCGSPQRIAAHSCFYSLREWADVFVCPPFAELHPYHTELQDFRSPVLVSRGLLRWGGTSRWRGLGGFLLQIPRVCEVLFIGECITGVLEGRFPKVLTQKWWQWMILGFVCYSNQCFSQCIWRRQSNIVFYPGRHREHLVENPMASLWAPTRASHTA